jgi:hypothetical protein
MHSYVDVAEAAAEWTIVPSPNASADANRFNSVGFVNTNRGYAVGYYFPSGSVYPQPLIERWTGSAWEISPITKLPDGMLGGVLEDITVDPLTDNNTMAVGYYINADGIEKPLALEVIGSPQHWEFLYINYDEYPGINERFTSVGMGSPDTRFTWAAGYRGNLGNERPLVWKFEWISRTWEEHRSVPPQQNRAHLRDITGIPAIGDEKNVMAVGDWWIGSRYQTLVDFFDSWTRIWEQQSSPNVGAGSNVLEDLSARSATDIWAVGYYYDGAIRKTLAMRNTTGSNWSVVSTPNVGTGDNFLYGTGHVSSNYVWATGFYFSDQLPGMPALPITMRWNGSTWSQVPAPSVQPIIGNPYSNYLWDVAVVPGTSVCAGGDIWAVGHYVAGYERTLTMRYTIEPACTREP